MRPHHCELCHIDLKHVSVSRGGQEVLQDVSMHIHCSQLTVLIGQNGAGKTTLIKILTGQLQLHSRKGRERSFLGDRF